MTSLRLQCCSDRRVVIFHPLDPRTTFLNRRPDHEEREAAIEVSVPGRGGNSGWTSGVEIPMT
jgi:hypothetical protein